MINDRDFTAAELRSCLHEQLEALIHDIESRIDASKRSLVDGLKEIVTRQALQDGQPILSITASVIVSSLVYEATKIHEYVRNQRIAILPLKIKRSKAESSLAICHVKSDARQLEIEIDTLALEIAKETDACDQIASNMALVMETAASLHRRSAYEQTINTMRRRSKNV